MPPPIRFALTEDEVSIAYSVHGSGPPLVYVRGWIAHLDLQWMFPDYRLFMEALGRHFTVIRYDMRGNGMSERNVTGRLTLDDLATDVIAVLEACGVDRATFFASCYGAPIMAKFNTLMPGAAERIIFDGPFAQGSELGSAEMRDSILASMRLLETQPGAATTLISYYTNRDVRRHNDQERQHTFAPASINSDVAMALYDLSFSLECTKDYLNINAPTLVTHRRKNGAVPFDQGRKVAALVPKAVFIPLEGKQVNPWDGDASESLRAYGEFLGVDLTTGYVPHLAVRPTVVLFSDIVSSTATASALGDARAHEINRVFYDISRDAVEVRGGRYVKSMGDGVMAEFPSVSQAIGCAIDMQNNFGDLPVRIGINAGEPVSEDDDLHGIVVTTASRVCGQGGAGEIIVSNVVRELATGKDFVFESIGERHLKGLGQVPLYRVTY